MRARFVILANGILTTPEAGPHRGHGDVPGRVVPHVALELQRRPGRQAGRHHRHRRHRRAGHPRAGQGRRRALRLPAHAVDDRRARPARDDAGGDRGLGATSRAGRGPAGPGSPRSRPGAPAIQANDDYLAGKVADFKERKRARAAADARGADRRSSSTRNFRIMEQIRARVDAIVEDPKTAAALKPYYPYGCKRPTFHDEYLPTFNLPNVHLVDTAPIGVQRDQRARRRARRRRVPARRADLRHRLPVDGDVDVQHDRRAAAAGR